MKKQLLIGFAIASLVFAGFMVLAQQELASSAANFGASADNMLYEPAPARQGIANFLVAAVETPIHPSARAHLSKFGFAIPTQWRLKIRFMPITGVMLAIVAVSLLSLRVRSRAGEDPHGGA